VAANVTCEGGHRVPGIISWKTGACMALKGCSGADFNAGSAMRPTWDGRTEGGTHLKAVYAARKIGSQTQSAIKLPAM
jgi:hypothetical protein